MKKVLSLIICIAVILGAMPTMSLADGGMSYEFTYNGFNCWFNFECVPDETYPDVYLELRIFGYYGSTDVDVNMLPNGVPKGLYIHQILEGVATEDSEMTTEEFKACGWENYKDLYVEVSFSLIEVYNTNVDIAVSIVVDGDEDWYETEDIIFADQKPILKNDRTMLPIRAIAEFLEWEVTWNQEEQSVIIENEDKKVKVVIGNKTLYEWDANGKRFKAKTTMDVTPMILNGRTLLPVRAIAEALDLEVEWNQEEQCVYLIPEGVEW